jgi:RimJ/RimL family protein N-acetyltransferase
MTDFMTYYKSFLGIGDNDSGGIISCERRSGSFSMAYTQMLIMTKLDGNYYYSIAPEYYKQFSDTYIPPANDAPFDEFLRAIDDTFCELKDQYRVNKMLRHILPDLYLNVSELADRVETLGHKTKNAYFRLMGLRGMKYKEKRWEDRKDMIEQGRYFVFLENNDIASYAFLTDLDYGAANIVVVTLPQYRKKGYGKAVVTRAVQWCIDNDILPIYLVDHTNTASIRLATSLGFTKVSEEVIVTCMN